MKRIVAAVMALCLVTAPVEAKPSVPHNPLSKPYAAPEFTGIQNWLNSEPLTLKSMRGKVVLIDFWTYSCINCIRTLPYITQWDRTYRDKGLVIIGVHAPEFNFEKNIANIKKALAKYTIEYPIAIDNGMDTWNAFKNRYWPAHYLIDKQGNVVYTHFGEGQYQETENNIRALLGLEPLQKNAAQPEEAVAHQTPETYLGSARAKLFASPEKSDGNATSFTVPESLLPDHWALSGAWSIESERIISKKAGSMLRLHFTAKKVFLVLGTQDNKPQKIHLRLNGKPLETSAGKDVVASTVTIDHHALYELVNQPDITSGILEISTASPGLEAYAFTFGNE